MDFERVHSYKFGKTPWIVDRPTGNQNTRIPTHNFVEGRSQTRFPGSLIFQKKRGEKNLAMAYFEILPTDTEGTHEI
jgi:hypothetical protein